jgi:hypothetical protein
MAVPDCGDVRRDVEVIRGIVDNFDCPPEAELKRLHQAHCGFCEDVNGELEACESLIDANDEMQAVQRAERGELLEIIATLASFDSEGWNEFLDDKRLKHPPQLRLDAADRLNQCFGPVRLQEPLMRELRWHSLAGSSLHVRLGVMHRLRATDENQAAWEDDIREFEAVRLSEINQDLEAACSQGDASRLGMLCRELTAKNWVKKPGADLIKRARLEFRKCSARKARTAIPRILEELRNAESGGESQLTEGRRLMQQLEVQLEKARFPEGAEEFELAREAVEWIVELSDHEQTRADYDVLVGEMDQLMTQFVSMKTRPQRMDARDQLQQLEYKFQSFDDGLPENLVNRIESVYDSVEQEERRAHALRLTGIACVVVTLGVILYFGQQYRNYTNQLAAHEVRLTQLVELADFPATDSYLEKLKKQSPDVLEHPPIAALISQHQSNETTEQQRRTKLMSGLTGFDDELSEVNSLSAVKALSTRINELESICQFENELNDIELRRNRLKASQAAIQEQIDEQFTKEFDALHDRYQQVDSSDVASLKSIRDGYGDLEKRSDVSSNLTAPISLLRQRIMSQVNLVLDDQKQQLRLAGITRTIGSWSAFHAALEQFSKEFASSSRGAQMSRILSDEASVWTRIEEQNTFIRAWSKLDFSKFLPDKAGAFVESGSKFLVKHPDFKEKRSLEELLAYMESVSERENGDGDKIIEPLVEVLRSPVVAGLFMLMSKDRERVYTREKPRELGNLTFQIKQIDDASLSSTTVKTYRLKELAPPVRDGTRINWDSPQSKFALEATISLNRMGNADWEGTMLELIDKLVDDEVMDPIIRFQLINSILPVALEGSLLLKNTLKTADEEFASVRLGANLNIFDPSDGDTIMARRVAERHLKNLPNMSDVLRDVTKTKATVLSTDIGNPWQWVAWLCKDSETQEWTCEAKKPPPAAEQGDLFVADNVDGTPSFIKIGIIEKGKYHVTATGSAASLVEGRPVFSHLSDAR